MTLESMKIEQENKEDFDELGELGPIHEEPLEQQHPHQFISQPSLNFIPSEKAIIGTPITVNHKNYLLMFDMLNGIKLSVSLINSGLSFKFSPRYSAISF